MEQIKEVYQELYTSNSYLFKDADVSKDIDASKDTRDKNVPFYIALGIKGRPFEEDLVIPITKDYLNNLTLKKLLDDQIIDKDEDAVLESLQLGNIIEFDRGLNRKLKKTFFKLKDLMTDSSTSIEIYSEPLNFGKCSIKGHLIKEKRVDLTELVLLNLIYIEINSPVDGYNNIKQYIVRFKIDSYNKNNYKYNAERHNKTVSQSNRIVSKSQSRFGPFETPVLDYTTDKYDMMKIPVVKKRIDERKKWLPEYSDEDVFFLIFSPVRFLRLKQMQNKLTKDYTEKGVKKVKPSIVKDIRENALFGGLWEYKDIEYLLQIDLLVENGIIVPTDFSYYSPPYAIVYKAVKDGVLIVGGIEHYFQSSKAYKQGHFITYMSNRKMGKEGTQVLIKYRDDIGNTNNILTCEEMDQMASSFH
jgi:hypothetical protein